jgi:hypothetical protein
VETTLLNKNKTRLKKEKKKICTLAKINEKQHEKSTKNKNRKDNEKNTLGSR